MDEYRVNPSSLRFHPGNFLSLLPIFILVCVSTLRAQEPATLASHPPVECAVGGSLRCNYEIKMLAGQYARITVRQIGINVRIELVANDGPEKLDYDSEIKTTGEVPVDW